MRPLAYARARDVADAVRTLNESGASVLAGGTELLNWMRLGIAEPPRVLDVSRLPELAEVVELPGGGLRIGAAMRLNATAAHPAVAAGWPVLSEAIHKAASAQIRNLATVGGNLLQKTRCAYFRSAEPTPCNRRAPGSGCAALRGDNSRHAIFGWTEDCVATQPSDPAAALAVLDATVVVVGPGGERRVPVTEFHRLPGDTVRRDSVLQDGELVTAVELPAPAPRSAYLKVRERESYEYALVSAAAAVELDGERIRRARIALGSVALRPWRLTEAEDALVGLSVRAPEVAERIGAALGGARPLAHNSYKVVLARNAAARALRMAAEKPETPEKPEPA